MSAVHIPIPPEAAGATAAYWLPFVDKIVRRSKNSVAEIVFMVERGELQLHLAWEPETKTPLALALTRIFMRGGQPVVEYCYHWGPRREKWQHLLPELERYHHEKLGCAVMQVWAPEFWAGPLEQQGYRRTHVIMEKNLDRSEDDGFRRFEGDVSTGREPRAGLGGDARAGAGEVARLDATGAEFRAVLTQPSADALRHAHRRRGR